MADGVTRVVPLAITLDRAVWQARERQKRKEKENPSPPKKQRAGDDGSAAAPEETTQDKGKHLDVSA